MAEERILPNLKTRLTLDSAEMAKGREQAAALRSSLADVGTGAKAGGAQLQSGLITPLRAATDAAQVFAAKKIFDFGKAGFEEMKGASVVTAQTTNLLKNLGPAAGASMDDVEALSGAMLRQSGVDDELAQAAINTTWRLGVQGDQMKRVVQDANDLSQSFGDINTDSELLAKALAKPEAAAKLLKPAIGALTEEQQKSIASFVAQGDTASAQNVILDAVEAKVHGAAAAYGETLPGQVAIAQQSLANLKGELVGSLVPALSFATQGEQFLIDEIDRLPEGAKAAVGGVGLLAAGVVSLARPVGDVVRLYQTWRQRSEEVAAATAALAASEAAEATASAAGAASTASATAVTVASTAVTNESAAAAARRIVSNEALVFSDAEIVAAEQARFAAEMQTLVSNDALILSNEALAASDVEVAAASTATAGKSGGLASALGKAGVAAAAATAVYALYSYGQSLNKTSLDTDELRKLTKLNSGQIVSAMDQLIAMSKGPFSHLFDDALKGLVEQGPAGIGVLKSYRDQLAAAGQDTSTVDKILQDAATSQANLTANQDAGSAALKGQTAATDVHKRSLDELRAATDALTDAEKAELAQADAAAKAHEEFAGLIDNIATAMDRQYKATLNNVDLISSYEGSVDSLTETLKTNGYTLDLHEASGRADQKALEDTGAAISALIEMHFKQSHSIEDAITWGGKYVGNLQDQLAAAGYNKDQIAEMIDTINLTPEDIRTNFSSNAVEQQIVIGKYLQQLQTIDDEKVSSHIETLIDQGKFDEANQALDNLAHGRNVYYRPEMASGTYYAPDTDIPRRAHGGDVKAHMPYLVGDKYGMANAELFVPDVSGTIYPEVPRWGANGGERGPRIGLNFENAVFQGDPAGAVSELDWLSRTKPQMAGV